MAKDGTNLGSHVKVQQMNFKKTIKRAFSKSLQDDFIRSRSFSNITTLVI